MKGNFEKLATVQGRITGFTLIELLIVVSIVAILTVLAIPSYMDYARRGNVPEATTCLSQWRTNMEQYFQDERTYLTNPSCGNTVCAGKHFDVTLACTSSTTYTLTADGHAGGSMEGFQYTLDESNNRTSTTADWGAGATCWITKRGETC